MHSKHIHIGCTQREHGRRKITCTRYRDRRRSLRAWEKAIGRALCESLEAIDPIPGRRASRPKKLHEHTQHTARAREQALRRHVQAWNIVRAKRKCTRGAPGVRASTSARPSPAAARRHTQRTHAEHELAHNDDVDERGVGQGQADKEVHEHTQHSTGARTSGAHPTQHRRADKRARCHRCPRPSRLPHRRRLPARACHAHRLLSRRAQRILPCGGAHVRRESGQSTGSSPAHAHAQPHANTLREGARPVRPARPPPLSHRDSIAPPALALARTCTSFPATVRRQQRGRRKDKEN